MSVPPVNRFSGDHAGLTILEHLTELRRRIITVLLIFCVALLVSLAASGEALDRLAPFRLVFISPGGAVAARLRLAWWSAFVLTWPVLASQALAFAGPGLTRSERRVCWSVVLAGTVCCAAGACFALGVLLPLSLPFLLGFAGDAALALEVSAYLDFALGLLVPVCLACQLPVLGWAAGALGLIRARALWTAWRWAVIGILVASALLTPPDAVSQMLLAAPMLGLYALSVLAAYLGERRRPRSRTT
ncbi:MAG: twin-arginine translocase subunit TatC, partial [Bacillota bacterium]